MAGVMTDHEQPYDAGGDNERADQLQRNAGGEQDDGSAGAEQHEVGR